VRYYARACKRPIYNIVCYYYYVPITYYYYTIQQCIIPALALGKLRYAAGGPTLLIGFRFMRWRLITATFLGAYIPKRRDHETKRRSCNCIGGCGGSHVGRGRYDPVQPLNTKK